MEQITIQIQYINNVMRHMLPPLMHNRNSTLTLDALADELSNALNSYLDKAFDKKRIYILYQGGLIQAATVADLLEYISDGILFLSYSEIIPLNNAAHLAVCRAKHGEDIVFDIYPREQNHRFQPHLTAKCQNEVIRIALSDPPYRMDISGFSGNNRANEKIALEYVSNNLHFFMREWKRYVESQFE